MFRLACLSLISGLVLAAPAQADNRRDLVDGYVERIVVNALDEPDRHEPYFTETQLLNDFTLSFVEAYTGAVRMAKAAGSVVLFETDAMTGDPNRCPIGKVGVIDRTRADTRNMIDVSLQTPDCGDNFPEGGHRLMFIFEPVAGSSSRYAIDDVLRPLESGGWFSLKAWLERQASGKPVPWR
ncbi:hypothetical protein J5J10_06330 [Ciceribacter sp. L1K23]|uniref:hypothetical protein n=1 Tax=Ciceribacter sp. L1K23 TaxID=2820276 RepID=UPI001B825829|nr:hypothetical protein [Ciceribacter sp. L1K23]MBR0555294.1 hypothetical protein [Ciceribacter sp. L1K23]